MTPTISIVFALDPWFAVRVTPVGECWEWRGRMRPDGYGTLGRRANGQMNVRAHRWAYTLINGPIPSGLVLDHLCRNKRCVNPDHLEAVTQRENVLRGIGPEKSRSITHCKWGHPLSEFGVRYSGHGYCLVCQRRRNRAQRAKGRIAVYARKVT